MIEVAIINHSNNPLPSYQTVQSAGMDLYAYLGEPISLQPFQRTLVPTGIHIALPVGTEAQVRPRSGMALKQGITLLNSPGTIDSDYRGEIKVLLVNLSNETQIINSGDRIAQIVIARFEQCAWLLTDNLAATERGAGGFGHTGTN
jgi:dUTP pyrophosphatase